MTENNGYIAIMVTCGQDKCTSLLENSYLLIILLICLSLVPLFLRKYWSYGNETLHRASTWCNSGFKTFWGGYLAQYGCMSPKTSWIGTCPYVRQMSLCPTNCPYVRQKCPYVRQIVPMSNKNVHKVKLAAGGRRSLRVIIKMRKFT